MRPKYGAVPTLVDGIKFASKKEAARYRELKLLVLAGAIRDLQLQPRFVLTVQGVTIGKYIGDFRYEELTETGGRWDTVVEDVKGVKTPIYRLKKRIVEALYGIDIRET
jgi:hypothetical protein